MWVESRGRKNRISCTSSILSDRLLPLLPTYDRLVPKTETQTTETKGVKNSIL